MNTSGETPDWQQRIKTDIGENPARVLDRRIPNPPPQNSMFRARLQGIDRLNVIGAWQAVEKRLRRGISEDDLPDGVDDPHAVDVSELGLEPGREHVLRLLDERRDFLLEHGERPAELDAADDEGVPERFQRRERRRVPEKEWYWIEGVDKSGERRPWRRRPTRPLVGGRAFDSDSGPDAVATDGGDRR